MLETVRVVNDVDRLRSVLERAGTDPEVVLEATYGWYWAVDALQAGGAHVHLAHPLGAPALSNRFTSNGYDLVDDDTDPSEPHPLVEPAAGDQP